MRYASRGVAASSRPAGSPNAGHRTEPGPLPCQSGRYLEPTGLRGRRCRAAMANARLSGACQRDRDYEPASEKPSCRSAHASHLPAGLIRTGEAAKACNRSASHPAGKYEPSMGPAAPPGAVPGPCIGAGPASHLSAGSIAAPKVAVAHAGRQLPPSGQNMSPAEPCRCCLCGSFNDGPRRPPAVRSPVLHHGEALLEKITSPIGSLHLVAHHVGEGHLGHL